MHADILYEVLLFCTRQTLDAVRLVSKPLRNALGQSSNLPLRSIGRVWLVECGGCCFIGGLREDVRGLDEYGCHDVTLETEAGRRDCVHRLNNAFVEELIVCFACGTFLQYLRQHSGDFFCRLSKVSPICESNSAGAIRYDLVAFVAQKLEPTTYKPELVRYYGLRSQYLTLFDHESLRHNIELLEFSCEYIEIAAVLLFNVEKLSECNVHCFFDPAEWINEFIQTFQQAMDERRTISSLTIVLNGGIEDPLTWPPNGADFAPSGHVESAQSVMPPPRSAFLDKLLADGICCDEGESRTQTKCELHVFTNSSLGKRLHLYRWGVEEEATRVDWRGREPRTYYHEVTHIELVDL